MSQTKIKVIQYGLGPIGVMCAKWILCKPNLQIVGAVDIDPNLTGKALEDVLGVKINTGVKVSADLASVLKKTKADVAVHTTRSSLKDIFPQLEELVKAKISVVSSTEELLVPNLQNPALADKLDKLAKKNKVVVLGTGVNPGFVMDTLPLCLSSMCLDIQSIEIKRQLDASKRRLPLQKKIGSGMTAKEFCALRAQKKIGHVGLVESMDMLLKGLNIKADKIVEKLEPVIAKKDLQTKYLKVKKGLVCGIKHTAGAFVGKKKVISLDLRMFIGADESFDSVEIKGVPPIKVKAIGGIAGDFATVAALLNAIPRVLKSEPGSKTMMELEVPYAFDAI